MDFIYWLLRPFRMFWFGHDLFNALHEHYQIIAGCHTGTRTRSEYYRSESRFFFYISRVYGQGREYQRLTREISALTPNWRQLYNWGPEQTSLAEFMEEVRHKTLFG